jgi:hypothetical protein
LTHHARAAVAAVGETWSYDIRTRPDHVVAVHGALAGFIELEALALSWPLAAS